MARTVAAQYSSLESCTVQWFARLDDDTIVSVPRMAEMLSHYNPDTPTCVHNDWRTRNCMCGHVLGVCLWGGGGVGGGGGRGLKVGRGRIDGRGVGSLRVCTGARGAGEYSSDCSAPTRSVGERFRRSLRVLIAKGYG